MSEPTEQKPTEKPKRGPGKPKTIISSEDMRKAEGYAKKGHKNATICTLMGWDREWLLGRADILARFTQKRAEGQDELLTTLRDQSSKNPICAIFLSKQAENNGGLGFADRQEHSVVGDIHVHLDR